MATPKITIGRDPVKQFSVFAENRVGRLHDLAALLKEHNVHIMAITDKQYENIRTFRGRKREQSPKNPDQFALF